MSKKFGLALGSGGARGVAHIGFLQALEEEGIRPDYIAGCSMGAVVGACYASGMHPEDIRDIALELKTSDILDLTPAIISRMGLLRTKKVRELLNIYLGGEKIEDFEIPFACVATDLLSGNLAVFKSGDAVNSVLASCSIPVVFRPLEYQGMLLVDGCCLCRVPVHIVKEMGADVVVAVDVLKNASRPIDEVHNIVSMVLRMFDVMDQNQTELRRQTEGDMCDLLLEPEMDGMSQYKIKDLEKAYDEGLSIGRKNIDKIKELLS